MMQQVDCRQVQGSAVELCYQRLTMAVKRAFFVTLLSAVCQAQLNPFPLNATLAIAQLAAYNRPRPTPTGVNKALYLKVIKDVVQNFRQFQNKV
jgi:hypothetical protein